MKTKILVFNWKMNPSSLLEAKKLAKISDKKNVVICSPFLFLNEVKENIKNAEIGAQNVSWVNPSTDGGAYTGEISCLMLEKNKCKYVIVGHSERRFALKESDVEINKKIKEIISLKLKPILCIGSDKKDKRSEKEMESQIKKALIGVKISEIKNIVIAYEPVWAISTNKQSSPAVPEDAKKAEIFIRKILIKLFNEKEALRVKIIYGGSVDSKNIKNFIEINGISGVLVGGASLKEEEIKKMLKNR